MKNSPIWLVALLPLIVAFNGAQFPTNEENIEGVRVGMSQQAAAQSSEAETVFGKDGRVKQVFGLSFLDKNAAKLVAFKSTMLEGVSVLGKPDNFLAFRHVDSPTHIMIYDRGEYKLMVYVMPDIGGAKLAGFSMVDSNYGIHGLYSQICETL